MSWGEFGLRIAAITIAVIIGNVVWYLLRRKKTTQRRDDSPECNCSAKRDTEHTEYCPRYLIGLRRILGAMQVGEDMAFHGKRIGRDRGIGFWIDSRDEPLTLDEAANRLYDERLSVRGDRIVLRCKIAAMPVGETLTLNGLRIYHLTVNAWLAGIGDVDDTHPMPLDEVTEAALNAPVGRQRLLEALSGVSDENSPVCTVCGANWSKGEWTPGCTSCEAECSTLGVQMDEQDLSAEDEDEIDRLSTAFADALVNDVMVGFDTFMAEAPAAETLRATGDDVVEAAKAVWAAGWCEGGDHARRTYEAEDKRFTDEMRGILEGKAPPGSFRSDPPMDPGPDTVAGGPPDFQGENN